MKLLDYSGYAVAFLLIATIAHVRLVRANDDEGAQLRLTNCRQSSDYAGISRCTGAIDGNTNQRWTAAGHSTTNYDAHPFWETQTEQTTQFTKIKIYNRQDCCPERLNNFDIKVDGKVCAQYHSTTSFSVQTFDCKMEGRVLRIESTIQTHLTLAEVEVFGIVTDQTTAPGMLKLSNCAQSSNYQGGHFCTAAIDGNTKQLWSTATLATTNWDPRPWWEAHTEAPAMIKQVRIFNRQDCCPERLGNFVIKVDGKVCAEYNSGPFSVWTFDCNLVGSTVRIESRIATHLTLAEVQVFGSTPSKECFKSQEDFVGSSTVTASGKPCQAWSVKSCADGTKDVSCHVPNQILVDAALTGSTCRNPGDYQRDRPWCYTTTATRWEFCDVPAC